MPNIIDQLKDAIRNIPYFFSDTGFKENDLKHEAFNFLNSTTYGELEENSRNFMKMVLQIHGKEAFIGLPADTMNAIERYDPEVRETQRLHFVHLMNVYLLGLYLYHNLPEIKKAMLDDIVSSPNEIPYGTGTFDFSGDSDKGEFHYRWRLAAISHDIGYPIELSKNNICNLQRYIKHLDTIQQDITDFSDIERYKYWDIFNEIDISILSIDLHNYSNYQLRHPSHRTVFHDHGIYGSLFFLRLMRELLDREPNRIRKTNGGDIIFDYNLLHRALKKVARAIALHNIDSYTNAIDVSRVSNDRIYILHGDSLTWLLKVADELQEWYKFPRSEIPAGNEQLIPPNLSITFSNTQILVDNYLNEEKRRLSLIRFKQYYSPDNLIVFNNQ
jgi:hypothetical protein